MRTSRQRLVVESSSQSVSCISFSLSRQVIMTTGNTTKGVHAAHNTHKIRETYKTHTTHTTHKTHTIFKTHMTQGTQIIHKTDKMHN